MAHEAPARDWLYRQTRDGIMRGSFPAGTFLEEKQVWAALSVPRTPMRETLGRPDPLAEG